jgi:hypothetical protein
MLSRQSTVAKKIISEKYLTEDKSLHEAVDLWEGGFSDTIMVDGKACPGTIPGGPHVGKPAFQAFNVCKNFTDGGTMVAESENCVSFIPAGFRGGPTLNTMNPVHERIAGQSALMSLVHVLTIPKDKRIFNACTLHREHTPLLEEMKDLGHKAVMVLLNGPKDMPGSLQWVYAQQGTITLKDKEGLVQPPQPLAVQEEDLAPSCRRNFKERAGNIVDSFHVYPTASVGWLHLHTYVGDLLTTAHDTMEQDSMTKYGLPKNTRYEDIVDVL